MDEDGSKGTIANKNLSRSCSTDEDESKCIIIDKCSTEDDESESRGIIVNNFFTEEDKSEFVINKQNNANNEVTNYVPSYFNVFECGRKILDRLDMSYERACMSTV